MPALGNDKRVAEVAAASDLVVRRCLDLTAPAHYYYHYCTSARCKRMGQVRLLPAAPALEPVAYTLADPRGHLVASYSGLDYLRQPQIQQHPDTLVRSNPMLDSFPPTTRTAGQLQNRL